jgi:hypothetical protein
MERAPSYEFGMASYWSLPVGDHRGRLLLLPATPDPPGGSLETAIIDNPAMPFPSTAMQDVIDK